jgi:hypothetical protein
MMACLIELEPLHLDTLGEDDLDGVARRLKRFLETLPARERARFIHTKDTGVGPPSSTKPYLRKS